MKKQIIILIALFAVLVSGCIPVKVNSQKASDFSEKVESVVIWHDTETPVKILGINGKMKKIVDLISAELTANEVNNEIISTKNETLNVGELISTSLKDLDTFYVLKISAPRGSYSSTKSTFSIVASVSDIRTKKQVWSSSTVFTFENSSNTNAAESIVEKMIEDEVIEGVLAE